MTQMHKTNDSKFSYPKSALSFNIIIECGLKLPSAQLIPCKTLSFNIIIECGLKHLLNTIPL